jgi:hypothetical protein
MAASAEKIDQITKQKMRISYLSPMSVTGNLEVYYSEVIDGR